MSRHAGLTVTSVGKNGTGKKGTGKKGTRKKWHQVHDRKKWHKFISIIKNYNANCGMSCGISLLVPGGENCSAKWWWEEVI